MNKQLYLLVLLMGNVAIAQDQQQASPCGEKPVMTSIQRPVFAERKDALTTYFSNRRTGGESTTYKRGVFKVRMNCAGEIFQVEVVKTGFDEASNKQFIESILAMPKWKPAQLRNGTDYVFYLDILEKDGQLVINPIMR